MLDLVSTVIGVTGLALAVSGHLRAQRTEAVATRQALPDAGACIAGELAVLSVLAEETVEPVASGRAAGRRGAAQRSASLARLCASCERAGDLKVALREDGGLPDGAADRLDGLIADADRALREAERGEVPAPGLAPWRAEKLAAVLRAP
ncbi:MAG: hypothetical protein M3R38_17245 [Actinomycetota bacterium]|nr:hypothetical protein [Actinomycetota bacterium]